MRAQLADLVVRRLETDRVRIREQFSRSARGRVPTRHAVIDDLLPQNIAMQIYDAFPSPSEMREMKSFREHKRTSKDFNQFAPILGDISAAFHDERVIDLVGEITGIREQKSDPSFYAGGLSMMGAGHFLNPHIDNSHDAHRAYYRTLNLLYYTTPDWKPEYGGSLELWDAKVREKIEIPSLFNRLVLMETNMSSWHSVNPVRGQNQRTCVSNYYFSKINPNGGDEIFHVTSFMGRPEQTLIRAFCRADNFMRMAVRAIFPSGVGKKDVYISASTAGK
jgi:Rps23 Pro-64 3,4-dihydroxylase Tpa1-like proline 4-hydroxylase